MRPRPSFETRPSAAPQDEAELFPSVEQAIAAHNGPEYQAALKALGDGAVRDVRIVEALE